MGSLNHDNQADVIKALNSTSRYLDDTYLVMRSCMNRSPQTNILLHSKQNSSDGYKLRTSRS